jgi:hypothetical protein
MTSKGSKRIYKVIMEFESHFPEETLLKMYKMAARKNKILSDMMPQPLNDDAWFKFDYYVSPHSHVVEPLFPNELAATNGI